MITHKQVNDGSVRISAEAIAKVALLAAAETDGVSVSGRGGRVRVRLRAEAAAIELPLYVVKGVKGQNAVAVAESVQKNVKQTVQSMTGIAVASVNVKVLGANIEDAERRQRVSRFLHRLKSRASRANENTADSAKKDDQ
jgi:uncharacterized alkaline shock family protein YloU